MSQLDFQAEENITIEPKSTLQQEIEEKLDQARRQLKEVNLLIEQSQFEVSKLTQRNATATGILTRVQSQFDNLPREEIRAAYDAALDAQQRLFLMRGQLEKLQTDQVHLSFLIETLESILIHLGDHLNKSDTRRRAAATSELLEMLIQAQEAERQKLSRQMHDGPAQALSNLILETDIAMRLFEIDKEKAYEELNILKNSAIDTFQQIKDFIFELRPMILDDLGLVPTVKKYAASLKEQHGVEIQLDLMGSDLRLESYLELMIFRAVQELLGNALTHSQATEIKLQLYIDDQFVRVNVEDNGTGFDPAELQESQGMGLKVIQERVDMIGGSFRLDSQIGGGTSVGFQVPASFVAGSE